ncbi:MAG: 2-C-methyl-D-erythritol 2,4-cyclodiphosphate synthase [Lentisphaerae bacterium]|jgi:2-C-methyl-D-erythritol 2,4-cyclodiphosphate synthase|nr:2-C-methyl-D-erythritol 2,4-cyclodiphosphate synthase [Lentisphaerota bacterium]
MRIGFGYDSHVFDPAKPLVLGGVSIPGCDGLKAHSDGDVLLHAVIDAIFGAAAMGDIGSHFPDTDPKWRGADSANLLEACVDEVSEAGFRIGNLDVTVICEKPRLRPQADAIRSRVASLLRVDVSRVSVKGKTNEKMDDVGAGRGIVVHAVVLLEEA